MRIIFFFLSVSLIFGKCESPKDPQHQIMKLKLDAVLNTITHQDDNIIYSCWDSTVKIYSLKEEKILFSKATKDLCKAKPVVKNNKIYFPISDQKFVCLEISTGKILWELNLNGRCANFNFVDDTTILASSKKFGLLGINAASGKVNYELRYSYAETQLPDLSPWTVSWNSRDIFISNWQANTLSSYKKGNGLFNWHFKVDKFGTAGESIVLGDKLFVGVNNAYKEGSVFLIATKDGKVISKTKCKYEEREAPILLDNKIFFYSYDGYLNQFDINNGDIVRIRKFEKEFDLSGNQIFLATNQIYFSDASFFLNTYLIKENKFAQLIQTEKTVLFAFDYKDKLYYII